MRTLGLLAIFLALSGCASRHVNLTVQSEPVGAYISQLNVGSSGMAPQYFTYDKRSLWAREKLDSNGCSRVNGYVARWISGVETEISDLVLCKKTGYHQVLTLRRDPNAPGFEQDLQFAIQVQGLWAQQQAAIAAGRAADAASSAAGAAWVNAINGSKPVKCRTVQVGSSLQTTCN